ncbi:MAG: hypothetical protein ACRC41_16555 [Sarcina sp.]
MIVKDINLKYIFENYKKGSLNLLRNKAIKAFDGKVLILDENFSIKEKFDIANLSLVEFETLINSKQKIYFPFVDSFDSFVTAVNGIDFDLDEGLEPEWLEGVGYVESSSRLVDIGDLTISSYNIPGFILWKNIEFNILFAEYFTNKNKLITIDNVGFLKNDILNFINETNN